jgi:hypothetical protein
MGELIDTLAAAWISACSHGEEAKRTVVEGVRSRLDPGMIQLLATTLDSDVSTALGQEKVAAVKDLLAACSLSEAEEERPTEPQPDPFNLRDDRAVDWVRQCWMLYEIDGHFDEEIARKIADVAAEGLGEGLGRRDLAKLLSSTLSSFTSIQQHDRHYWDRYAGAVMNRARTFDQIAGLIEADFDHYEIFTAGDERCCERCLALDGKTYLVKSAFVGINELMKCRSIEEARTTDPWAFAGFYKILSVEDILNLPFVLPPFCDGCRCGIIAA